MPEYPEWSGLDDVFDPSVVVGFTAEAEYLGDCVWKVSVKDSPLGDNFDWYHFYIIHADGSYMSDQRLPPDRNDCGRQSDGNYRLITQDDITCSQATEYGGGGGIIYGSLFTCGIVATWVIRVVRNLLKFPSVVACKTIGYYQNAKI
jgi:hypothetical protein